MIISQSEFQSYVQVEESLCICSCSSADRSDISGYKNTATLLTGVKYSSAH